MKCAAFRGNYINSVLCYAIAKWAEAMRVPGADKLLWGHEDQRVCSFQRIHCTAQCFLDRRSCKPFLCNYIRDSFRIARCMKNGPCQLKRGAKLRSVRKIAVMRNGHPALLVIDHYRLAVGTCIFPCRSIPCMCNCHGPIRK